MWVWISCNLKSRQLGSRIRRTLPQLPKDILNNLGHLHSKTTVHCNNTTAVCIPNNTVKRQHLWSMEIRFLWVGDKCAQDMYKLSCTPDRKILPITRVNFTLGLTMMHNVRDIYTWRIHPWYYHGLWCPAIWTGVLEPLRMGTYVGYLYHGLHGSRSLSMWLQQQSHVNHTLPVTHRSHGFPRGVIFLLDHS